MRFSVNPRSGQTRDLLSKRAPLGERDFLRKASFDRRSIPDDPAQSNGPLTQPLRRFQFSLGGLLEAIGIFAVVLWLLRPGLDSKTFEIVALTVLVVPIVLASAVELSGEAVVGGMAVARSYCFLALSAWLLAIFSIGTEAISDGVFHKLAIMILAG